MAVGPVAVGSMSPAWCRRPVLRVLAALVVGGLLAGGISASAVADSTAITVQALSSTTIDSGPKSYTEAKANKGVAQVVALPGDGKIAALVYVAPDASRDTSDTLSYKADGASREVLITISPAAPPPTLTSPELYARSFKTLFALFIIAVVLESGLALIFNWRPFVLLFDSRGVRTIVAFVVAYIFVERFDMDLVTGLVNIYAGSQVPVNLPGKVITALVIAGGSSGVNNLLVALGFRSVRTEQQVAPKPPATVAWVSVRLIRKSAKGMVSVLIGPTGAMPQAAGSIAGSSSQIGLLRFFLRDRGRFPTAGGWVVTPGQPIEIRLEGVDDSGKKLTSPTWGPCALSPGALVDVELAL